MSIEELTSTLKALADPVRLKLLRLLAGQAVRKDIGVGGLAKELNVSQPNVSHHLKILKTAGLIRCERRDNYSYYILNEDRLADVSKQLQSEVYEE
jgi:ArsR family transcriptional regulator, arsenate/arsenite/antimonite-responsive transcriptional repressor